MSVIQIRAPLELKLVSFIDPHERANNNHDISRVMPLIAENATYWFSDGSYRRPIEIRATSEKTFAKIVDKVYEVQNREPPVVTAGAATCRYWFASPRLGSWEEKCLLGPGAGYQHHHAAGDKVDDVP